MVNCELGVSGSGGDGGDGRVLTEPFVACPLELEIRPVLRSFQGPRFRMKPSGREEVSKVSLECASDD